MNLQISFLLLWVRFFVTSNLFWCHKKNNCCFFCNIISYLTVMLWIVLSVPLNVVSWKFLLERCLISTCLSFSGSDFGVHVLELRSACFKCFFHTKPDSIITVSLFYCVSIISYNFIFFYFLLQWHKYDSNDSVHLVFRCVMVRCCLV